MERSDSGAHAFPHSPQSAGNSSHWLLISTRSFTSRPGFLLLPAGRSSISTAHEGQYTSPDPAVRIHSPPHLSQYFSSNRMISKPSASIDCLRGLTSLLNFRRQAEAPSPMLEAQTKKPCADCSVTGPVSLTENLVNLFS